MSAHTQTWAPSHPRASSSGCVYEHILIAERALGRLLPEGSNVHHVDGNPKNNAPSNLVICQDMAYHKLLHVRANVVLHGGDPNTQKFCGDCERCLPFDRFHRCTANLSTGLQSVCRRCHERRKQMRRNNFETTGRIENGKLKLRNVQAFESAMARWKDSEVIVRIEGAHATRTVDQNKVYWAAYVTPLSEHTGYEPLEIHAYLKKRFLPNQHLMIQDTAGVVVDEADIEPTTTRLDRVAFGEYLRAIETWAAVELGLVLTSNREAA